MALSTSPGAIRDPAASAGSPLFPFDALIPASAPAGWGQGPSLSLDFCLEQEEWDQTARGDNVHFNFQAWHQHGFPKGGDNTGFLEDPRGQEGRQMSHGTAPSPLRSRKGRALLAELFIFCQVLSGSRTVKVTQDLSLLSQLYISESQNRKDPQGSESKISSGRLVL